MDERGGRDLPLGPLRAAVAGSFLVHGMAGGTWAARVPWVADRLDLSAGMLGLALLVPAIGALGAFVVGGPLVGRYGAGPVTVAALLAMCATLGLLTAVPRLGWLMGALLCFGVAGAVCDVAMNAVAVDVESRSGRPVMSGLHARWSIGALAAGAVGAVVAHAGVGAPVHLGVAAVTLGCGAWLCRLGLAPRRPAGAVTGPPVGDRRAPSTARLALPPRHVVPLGILCAAAMLPEAAGNEWSAVYAHRVAGVEAGAAATAYAAFALAMMLGRLAGDRVTAGLGAVRTLRVAGVVAVGGGAVVAAARTLPVTVAGFAVLGLGLSVAVPLVFGAAGHRGGERAGASIAGVATFGYLGWMAGPALIGGVAQVTSLPAAFTVVAGVAGLITVLAGAAGTAGTAPDERPAADLSSAAPPGGASRR